MQKTPKNRFKGFFGKYFPRKNWSLANECETKQFFTEDYLTKIQTGEYS